MAEFTSSLVSVDWLAENLYKKEVVILNATIPKVSTNQSESINFQIPNSRFFDLKKDFSNTEAKFPNTVPSTKQFNEKAQKLGVNNSSIIIVYDEYGIYSSARAWWLFKAFGHSNIAVLDGGLPAWTENKNEVEEKGTYNGPKGDFLGVYNKSYFSYFEAILAQQNSSNHLIIDARANHRFHGNIQEPRKGLRSGHIPNSVNLPYQKLIDNNGKLKTANKLKTIYNSINKEHKEMIFSCGSGVTACILALAAELSGFQELSVYDGSWTEYGTLTKE